MQVLDLFSGIGCFSLGLERAGMKTVAFCEIAEYPRAVLQRHWPGIPIFEDIRLLKKKHLPPDIQVMCGGFPCQNISIAANAWGGNTGLEGSQSSLWFEYARLIKEVRPEYVIIENVKQLASKGLDRVLKSLAKIRYDAEWEVVGGTAVGAPQARERVWIIAYPSGKRTSRLFEGVNFSKVRQGWKGGAPHLLDISKAAFTGSSSFPKPLLRGVDDRPAYWVDRVAGCGNAVFPQIAEAIGKAIMKEAA